LNKGTKKPWTKVGKLEKRMEQLEKKLEQVKEFHKVDFEELAARNETNKSAINILHKSLLTRMDSIDNLMTKLQSVFREW